jgi:hypothetical protein
VLGCKRGKVKVKKEVRDVIKPVDRITWDMQIGGLLDLKSLAWNGCSAMRKRWEVMREVKRKERKYPLIVTRSVYLEMAASSPRNTLPQRHL